MPGDIFMPGNVGVVSRSGTLTYEAVDQLSKRGIGQSLCIGIGGDPVVGTSFIDVLDYFISDDLTEYIVFIGEIGGIKEQEAAEFLKSINNTKPIAALIVGASAPKGKRMGHAGAVISGEYGKAESKINSLKDAGCHIIPHPGKIAEIVEKIINF
jgi:succinyl-CoA synthetase alpha subunit